MKCSQNTQQEILDAAECLFGIHGFYGTTLRGIVNKAGANLAAVSYHFGSKEELYRAVVGRMSGPIVAYRTIELAKISAQPFDAGDVLNIYITAIKSYIVSAQQVDLCKARFLARYFMGPISVQKLITPEISLRSDAIVETLQTLLPGQSRMQLSWQLTAINIMISKALEAQVLEAQSLHASAENLSELDLEKALSEVLSFALYGVWSVA